MPLITFMSDFGLTDYYIAAVKAKLYTSDSSLQIVDISHQIDSFDLSHASFILRSVYRDFPQNTVHLIAVGASSFAEEYIAVQLDNHFFVSADNGIISLLSEQEPQKIVRLSANTSSTFAAKDILAPAVAAIASGKKLEEIGQVVNSMNRKIPRQLKANKKMISGNIIHVDNYGNLITNIDRYTFDVLSKDINYEITVGREHFSEIQQNYFDVDYGECALFFNHQGLLEISINHGSASVLLGLAFDSPVHIRFER
ncbi:S-adenosylmethionine hydrolase [Catalinimonas alkaloidigena]|uniref:SAM hydrolase/SAM-dependent halogenase family protein n=1 Tax=Catalinimonas alkaloidigena TaxID=1075417 RepID=UPI002404AB16|nr:SAM-dependent chlorinase/fluorinase [Catalinimonas alkaloidigena]MDF9795869.1 S-adenosylmethionine hydrolase [Catalinimonas alkaloidigena]